MQNKLPVTRPEELVFVSSTHQPLTDSFLVAEHFGKRHEQVLRKLKTLNCSVEFTKHNFVLSHKVNESQNNKRQPFYQMTKDGFMFLVMGFTGSKAAAIKEKYIKAFNEMAEKLATPPEPLPLELFTTEAELMNKFMKNLKVRMMFEIEGGKVISSQVIPEDAFVCSKERLIQLMENSRIFTNQEIILINSVAAGRIAQM